MARFLEDPRPYPILAAFAAGLYPILFYFNNNYNMVNSWEHLAYFSFMFLLIPIVVFMIANRLSGLAAFSKWKKYVLPFLNIFAFLFFLKICLYAGLQKKLIIGIVIAAVLFAWLLHKHLKKVIVLQFVLAAVTSFSLIPTIIKQLNYSGEWALQPDGIEQATFTQKPNVYFIQPDGYVNFSELDKGYYKLDNSEFEKYLIDQGFTNYAGFRNNYASTLSSNSAIFMMRHHYYNKGTSFSEAINGRSTIISDNAVLNAFKHNGYKTHFIAEKPYLMLNRPKMGFDRCNFDYDEISYISTGLMARKEIQPYLEQFISESDGPSFYFIEFLNPGHIANRSSNTSGKDTEREQWIESLKYSNERLTKYITTIKNADTNALILIMGDHGGFIGLDYTQQIYSKTEDRDLIYSIFSSQLSILWPDENYKLYDGDLDSAVNVFRVLFSYLSEEPSYLQKLAPDESFVVIREGAPKGIYKYIKDDGSTSFERLPD